MAASRSDPGFLSLGFLIRRGGVYFHGQGTHHDDTEHMTMTGHVSANDQHVIANLQKEKW